jgi:aminopeptidase N
MRTSTGQPIRLADYRAPDYLIDSVELDVSLDRHATQVVATLMIRPNPIGRAGAALTLDGDELRLTSVALDGVSLDPAAVAVSPDQLILARPPQRPFQLRIETILDPAGNTKLMGLYRSGSAYCTQCEAEGFRRVTYFLDRPDVLSTYVTRLDADKDEAPILLANGNLEQHGDLPGTNRHFAIWRDPHKKPSYLFALVAGDLAHIADHFVTASGRKVDLGIYVEHGRQDRAAYAMDSLKRSMRWDEEAYGREYDLDVFNIVAVSDFNMGAMENKGLNIFNDKYVLALPETATDEDYAGIEAVIAHEYFHNWTGNRITCRDWFQLCLKEGLTVFRDQDFSAHERSAPVKRIADVRGLRAAQFPEDAGPLAHNVRPEIYHEINNFYTATVYQKGAEIVRMLRLLIGAPAFRAGMDLYFERCDGTAATVEDFLACFSETSGRDLTDFKRWYSQAGTPLLTFRSAYSEAARRLTLDISQTTAPTREQSVKLPLTMPIALGLIDAEGEEIALASADATDAELASGVLELAGASRRVVFEGVASRPTLSLLRGFSAPVRVDDDLTEADLLILSRHDRDSFNRWQAIQSLAMRWLLRAIAAIRAGRAPTIDPGFVDAYGAVLGEAQSGRLDAAFAAQALSLPSEGDIAREMQRDVDPDAIFGARETLRGALGRAHAPALARLHDSLGGGAVFSPDAASAGRRALRNVALAMLAAGQAEEGARRAQRQLAEANNMTEQFAGLAVLSLTPGGAREHALEIFARTHAADPLILDKWFILQAHIPEKETLGRVRGLMAHHAFSMSNPNRVRSLIGGFSANQTQFNRVDGAGYDLLAEVVLTLDPTNPQVAARLLSGLRSWRSLEPLRQSKAQDALSRIASQAQLSADVRDIVTRCLS